ncbi:single-stranded DNA-binding protein [Ureibacillus chungkukjangi]|uniref:single-stranded DNA-binding protein n=1 Tax=Ureibacillus chungkukjangi TaxID=1202712 RepID=UPI00384C8835
MINCVVIVGRLTKDPELRYTPSGVPMTRFTVAVNRTFSNQQGDREADFIQCIAWRKQAENLANFMKKGSLIGVEGRIQTGSFEGQDGKRVYTTDVIAEGIQYLEPRSNGSSNPTPNYQPQPQYQNEPFGGNTQQNYGQNPQYNNQQNYSRVEEDPFASNKGPIEVSEDDLPF